MDIQEKLAKLEDIMELDVGTLRPETLLEEIEEWDSLAALSYVVMMADDFGKTVKDVPDKGDRDISASAAALDVINGRLSEEGDPAAPRQREGIALILQQHHSFPGRPPGQRDMLLSRGHSPSVFPQGNPRQKTRPDPMLHTDSPPVCIRPDILP